MQLKRLVTDLKAGVCDETLGHRAIHGRLGTLAVYQRGCVAKKDARACNLHAHVCNSELKRLLGCEGLTKRTARLQV